MSTRSPGARRKAGRAVIATSVALAFGAAFVAPAAAHTTSVDSRPAIGRLHGKVGPDATISIDKSQVPAGRYKLIVDDLSPNHNFHIFGRGVDEKTKVAKSGTVTWKLKFRKGTYTIQCDPHKEFMHTSLTVT